MSVLRLLCYGLIVSPVLALADDPWTVNLYLDNDMFTNTDQDYTNGIRLSWVSPNLNSYINDPAVPSLVNRINRRLDKFLDFKSGNTRNVVISLGQQIYTPENREARELLVDERPYAGYLYLGFAYHARSAERLDTMEVNLGVVGPASMGEQAQDFIHDLRGFDKFNGWDNQLRNEPTLQLVYEQKRKLFRQRLGDDFEHDFIAHAGAALGNVGSYLNAGGEYRIGWDLPHDFGTSAVRPGGDNSAPGKGDLRLERTDSLRYSLHAFFAAGGRAVGNDLFLDGNTWKNSHSVDKEHLVAEANIGVSLVIDRWKLSLSHVFRTREFKGQPRHHEYGSLSISYTWW